MSSKNDPGNWNPHAADRDGAQEHREAPPAYEVHSSGSVLASSFAVNGSSALTSPFSWPIAKSCSEQGTVDVSFSGASPRLVNELLPFVDQPQGTDFVETSDIPSPHLNVVIHVVGSRGKLH